MAWPYVGYCGYTYMIAFVQYIVVAIITHIYALFVYDLLLFFYYLIETVWSVHWTRLYYDYCILITIVRSTPLAPTTSAFKNTSPDTVRRETTQIYCKPSTTLVYIRLFRRMNVEK